jgi:hypothetical protein
MSSCLVRLGGLSVWFRVTYQSEAVDCPSIAILVNVHQPPKAPIGSLGTRPRLNLQLLTVTPFTTCAKAQVMNVLLLGDGCVRSPNSKKKRVQISGSAVPDYHVIDFMEAYKFQRFQLRHVDCRSNHLASWQRNYLPKVTEYTLYIQPSMPPISPANEVGSHKKRIRMPFSGGMPYNGLVVVPTLSSSRPPSP